jgi:hypothetical protein
VNAALSAGRGGEGDAKAEIGACQRQEYGGAYDARNDPNGGHTVTSFQGDNVFFYILPPNLRNFNFFCQKIKFFLLFSAR